jgi:DNA-directed RNA polymerase alpha subunit
MSYAPISSSRQLKMRNGTILRTKPRIIRPLDSLIPRSAFDVRINNALERAGVKTMEQLAALTDDDILVMRNLGKTSLRRIRRVLEDISWGRRPASGKRTPEM